MVYRLVTSLGVIALAYVPAVHCQQGPGAVDVGGWRAARWGMTQQQVLAAFPGEVRRLPEPENYDFTRSGEGKYVGTVGIDEFELVGTRAKARFLFSADSGRLGHVVLSIEQPNRSIAESQFVELEKLLTEKYGARTFGDAKRQTGPLGGSVKLQALWFLPKTVIELEYNYMERVMSLITVAYRRVNKKARDRM